MQRGFSLVELSIVLVILGLLTGGILAGQSLIRAAELRSVATETDRYRTAAATFRDKYFALPGDITNATSFWGTTTCPATAGTGTQTCNGNGNGQIDAPPAASQYGEWFTFWQHLANAGLIEGSYTGMAGSGAYQQATSANVPSSKLSRGLWYIAYDASSFAAMFPVALPRNNLRLGMVAANSWPAGAIMKPEEVWNLDTKMDDGKPGLGAITVPMASYMANCADGSTAATAQYALSQTGLTCLYFAALTM